MPDWSDKTIKKLKELWDAGHSTAEIGKKLGFTKNAIVGKVHRLGLSSRGSPIISSQDLQKSADSDDEIAINSDSPKVKSEPKGKKQDGIPMIELTLDTCCYPLDTADGEIQMFCGKKVFKAKPYCLEHCTLAYTNGSSSEVQADSKNENDSNDDEE